MGVLLGLLSAFCYGASDFAAGLSGRRSDPSAITLVAQPWGLVAALVAVLVQTPPAPTTGAIWWGALSGVGSGVGTLALYRGLAVARMSVVAPISAVLAAALPVLVGIATGDRLTLLGWAGIAVVMPAIALISRHADPDENGRRAGVGAGVVAGVGFAALFIGLDRGGTQAGAWPVVSGQVVAMIVLVVSISLWLRPANSAWPRAWLPGTVTGVLAGGANLLFLAATGVGQLTVVAVLTSLYPAITVLLARTVLRENWSRPQAAGMLIAAAAVAAITLG